MPTRQVGKIEWRRIADSDFAIPKRLTLEHTDSDQLPFDVTITVENEAEPACVELILRPKQGGPPVTSERLRRLPVAQLVKQANEMFLGRLRSPKRGVAGGVDLFLGSPEEAVRATAAATAEERGARRRITDEDLSQLAEICRRADATGASYITLAGLQMGLTADQARQWKRKAVAAGLYERPAS